jgi:hypothetical protein
MSGGDCEKPPPGYSDVVKTLERQRAMTDCDDANNRNLEREVERHRRLINELAAMATNQQDDIALLRDEISLLKAQIPKPRIKVETRDEMPTIDQCSQIKAQLFHNLAKGGHGGSRRPEHQLKVGFWTCDPSEIAKYEDGTMKPFYFVLKKPEKWTPKDDASLLAQNLAHPFDLIGCHSLKVGGTDYQEQRLASITGSRKLTMIAPEWNYEVFRFPAIHNGKTMPTKPEPGENVPVEIWIWTPDGSP